MIKPICNAPVLNSSFNKGVEVWKKNFGPLLLAFLIVLLIGGVSCGICLPPLMCGFFGMVLAAMRDPSRPVQVGDVFNGFHVFGPSFVSGLVFGAASFAASFLVGTVPVLGWLASICISSVLAPAMVSWAQLISVDQAATVGEAISTPFGLLSDKRFWSFAGVAFLASLVGGLGALACGIGVFATAPLGLCVVAAAYEEMISAKETPAIPPPQA